MKPVACNFGNPTSHVGKYGQPWEFLKHRVYPEGKQKRFISIYFSIDKWMECSKNIGYEKSSPLGNYETRKFGF